jgi:predicted metal-dependent phosphotriesterase family hydrolase
MEVGTERQIRDQIREKVKESVGVHLVKSLKNKCRCFPDDFKKAVNESNISAKYKTTVMNVPTCGIMKDIDVYNVLKETGYPMASHPLRYVIDEFKKRGISKQDIDEKLLDMRERGIIRLDVGTPIGYSPEEVEQMTVSTDKHRFAHIKWIKR